MKKLIIILLCCVSFDAVCQNQVIDPTVEVNRDFEGKMMEVHKGQLNTAVADSLYNFKVGFNYSFFEKPYKDMYEFAPLASANLPQMENYRRPNLVVKGGIGYPLAPEVAIWYSPELKKGNFLKLEGGFNLFRGNVPFMEISDGYVKKSGTKTLNNEYKYGIGGNYTYAWKSGEFNVNAGFGGGYTTYYGAEHSSDNTPHHAYIQAKVGLGAKSSGAGIYGKKFNYAVSASLQHTQDKMSGKLQENLVVVKGEMGPTVGRYNKFMIGAEAEAVAYNGTAEYNYGIFGIIPQYRYENGDLKVNLGIKLEGKFTNNENGMDKHHNVLFPAINLSFGIVPQKLWLYGNVDGWNSLNTYSSLLEKNTHINPETTPQNLMAGSVPLNAEAGFKGRLTDKFTYRLYGGYSIHHGLQQFIYNVENGWFNTIYSNNNELYAGAGADVNTERVTGSIAFRYSSFSSGKENVGNGGTTDTAEAETSKGSFPVLGLPALQGDIFVQYNWNRKIYISAGCRLQGEYNCSAHTKIPGFADLYAGAEYVHSPMVSFWIKGENLLDAATQYHPFYTGREIAFTAGIIVKL